MQATLVAPTHVDGRHTSAKSRSHRVVSCVTFEPALCTRGVSRAENHPKASSMERKTRVSSWNCKHEYTQIDKKRQQQMHYRFEEFLNVRCHSPHMWKNARVHYAVETTKSKSWKNVFRGRTIESSWKYKKKYAQMTKKQTKTKQYYLLSQFCMALKSSLPTLRCRSFWQKPNMSQVVQIYRNAVAGANVPCDMKIVQNLEHKWCSFQTVTQRCFGGRPF